MHKQAKKQWQKIKQVAKNKTSSKKNLPTYKKMVDHHWKTKKLLSRIRQYNKKISYKFGKHRATFDLHLAKKKASKNSITTFLKKR